MIHYQLSVRPWFLALLVMLANTLYTAAPSLAQSMPSFQLPGIHSNTVESQKFAEQVVLINFWATWCPACRQEIPVLQRLHDDLSGEDFSVIGIAMDKSGPAMVAKFAKKMRLTYSLAMGNADIVAAFGGVAGIPTSFLIGRDGQVVKVYTGFVPHGEMLQDIKKMLDGTNHSK